MDKVIETRNDRTRYYNVMRALYLHKQWASIMDRRTTAYRYHNDQYQYHMGMSEELRMTLLRDGLSGREIRSIAYDAEELAKAEFKRRETD